jgi:hypothetical protein
MNQQEYNYNFLNDFYILTNNRLQEAIELFKSQSNIVNNYQITLDTVATRLLINHYEINRNIRNSNNRNSNNRHVNANINRTRSNHTTNYTPPPTPPRNILRNNNNLPSFLNNIRPPSNAPPMPPRHNNYNNILNEGDTEIEVEEEEDDADDADDDEVLLPSTPRRIIPSLADIRRNTRTLAYNLTEHNQTVCPIEHSSFNEGDIITQIIHCGHIFYSTSISRWFERDSRCPLCRYSISPLNNIDTFRQNVDNIIRNTLQTNNIPSPTINTQVDSSGNTIRRLDYILPQV